MVVYAAKRILPTGSPIGAQFWSKGIEETQLLLQNFMDHLMPLQNLWDISTCDLQSWSTENPLEARNSRFQHQIGLNLWFGIVGGILIGP